MNTEYIKLYRDFGSDLLSQVGSGVVNGAMGIGFGAIGNMIQSGQQQKNLEQQEAMNEKFANYSMGLQQKMWDYTNYENQVKHLQNAGMNPALLYGKGGGGGTTTGSVTAPAGMGIASNPGNQAIQAETMADINLKNAQAENIKANTQKTTGVDTTAVQATIDNVKQLTQNAKVTNDILQWEAGIKSAEATVATQTIDVAINTIQQTYNQLLQNIRTTTTAADISAATKDQIIQQARNATIQQGLNMILTKAQTQGQLTNIDATKNAINMAIQKNIREWDTMPNMSEELLKQNLENDLRLQSITPNIGKDILNAITHLIIPLKMK